MDLAVGRKYKIFRPAIYLFPIIVFLRRTAAEGRPCALSYHEAEGAPS